MPSATYRLFEQAMRAKSQIACRYKGHHREVCPIVLGHSGGAEKALTFQVGGSSSSGLPAGGEWRCLFLAKVSFARLHNGPWRGAESRLQAQDCVEIVALDVNSVSP